MQAHQPIGFFDSGLGGLSVLRTARRLLPHEDIVYYGDSANAPYGVRPPEEILALSRAAADQLMARGVKAMVIACNTATGVSLKSLQESLSIPVLGVQPALAAAQAMRGEGEILALATPATFKTERYAAILAEHGEKVTSLPCPGMMEFVERMELSGPGLHRFLSDLFRPYVGRPVSVVVLGCTHYPFLWPAIRPFFPGARPIDDGPRVSEALRSALLERGLLNPSHEEGKVTLMSSGGEEAVARMRALLKAGPEDLYAP